MSIMNNHEGDQLFETDSDQIAGLFGDHKFCEQNRIRLKRCLLLERVFLSVFISYDF